MCYLIKTNVRIIVILLLVTISSAFATRDLADVIQTLQIVSGISQTSLPGIADVDGDQEIGLAEAIFGLQSIAKVMKELLIVNLGTAENFVLLAQSGITTSGTTHITGNIGVSPIDSTSITGFGLIMDSSGTFATSSLVTGKIYSADYTPPTPANMTTAISDMQTAYVDAAGRTTPDYTELYAGDISGRTLIPGLYKWGTGVLITNAGVTVSGGVDDVWIFQIAGDLTVNNGAMVTLSGGAQARNIFWQVGGGTGVSLGTGCAFEGIILAAKAITINTGTSLNGRALAQTNITLNANIITTP
ncbi:ice antifreeze protein [Candidatus Magnetomorum sp. HK-1]|nr:ice antifreeze protein [Candidatus Magnetomorum sp. HK-1]